MMATVSYEEYLQACRELDRIKRERECCQYMINLRAKVRDLEKNIKSPIDVEIVAK